MIVFDIETKPRADLVKRFIKPPAPFDPSAVKYGNTKDPAKRAELLAAKEQEHADSVAQFWKNASERAALDPLTAEVVVIGLLVDGVVTYLEGTEHEVLTLFWKHFTEHALAVTSFVYWSGNGNPSENFDADMIIRRSWMTGVKVPATVFDGRYLSRRFTDAAGRYLLGERNAYCSLTDAADQLGLYGIGGLEIFPKTDEDPVKGVNFWQWYEGTFPAGDGDPVAPTVQRARALQYLRNDLLTLGAIADRIL